MAAATQRKGLPLGLILKGLIALLISVAAFWWAFHDVDMAEVGERLGNSSPLILVVFLFIQLANHFLRTWRWGLLIGPLGPASPRAILAASCIGFPATFFLPLRLGEFVRPVMIQRSGVPFAGAMASVVVERVADGLFNLGLFFLLLSMLPADAPVPDDLRTYSMLALMLFGGALIVLIAIVMIRRPALALIERLMKPIAPGVTDKVLGLLGAFIDGLAPVRSGGRLVLFFVLTVVYWLINGFSTWMLATSYIDDLPVMAGPFAITVVVFAIMIPAGPAFAGTLEAGFKFGLAPFGITAGPAGALALAHHAVQLVMMAILVGFGFMVAEPGQTGPRPGESEGPAPDPTGLPPEAGSMGAASEAASPAAESSPVPAPAPGRPSS